MKITDIRFSGTSALTKIGMNVQKLLGKKSVQFTGTDGRTVLSGFSQPYGEAGNTGIHYRDRWKSRGCQIDGKGFKGQ